MRLAAYYNYLKKKKKYIYIYIRLTIYFPLYTLYRQITYNNL